jgi:Domain of unknown function (DUF4148)
MNRNLISAVVLAAAALGAGQAFADDITIDTTPFTSTKSRAEVQAELSQYKAAGVNPWSTSYNPLKSFQSTKSVADVRGEFLASRNEVAAMNAEDSGSAYLNQTARISLPTGTTLAGSPVNAQ